MYYLERKGNAAAISALLVHTGIFHVVQHFSASYIPIIIVYFPSHRNIIVKNINMAEAIQKKLKAEVEKYTQMQKGRC